MSDYWEDLSVPEVMLNSESASTQWSDPLVTAVEHYRSLIVSHCLAQPVCSYCHSLVEVPDQIR